MARGHASGIHADFILKYIIPQGDMQEETKARD